MSHDGVVDQMARDVVAEALDSWPSPLEATVFGTEHPDRIVRLLHAYCRDHLGAELTTLLFYRRGVGAVFGLRLADGRAVVVKVHRPDLVGGRMAGVVQIQRHLADLGLPAPRPFVAPARLGPGIATAEELLDPGTVGDGHLPKVREGIARGLHEFVAAASDLVGRVYLHEASPYGLPPERLWPIPHDLRFDLTLPGGEWIDALAAQARERLGDPSGDFVIGHCDWRVENLRIEGDRIVAIFDWDSVHRLPEPGLVGGNAAGFSADYTVSIGDPRPSREESRTFVSDYEVARGRPFTRTEIDTANAAYVYTLAYSARCEHSDVTTGAFPDPGVDGGWRGLLRQTEDGPLLRR